MSQFVRRLLSLVTALLLVLSIASRASAQQTAADSAKVLLDASRLLQQKGEPALAAELLRVLRNRWPDSPAAREITSTSGSLPDGPVSGFARTGFIAYHTALGAWLGIAIPVALGAEGPEPIGAGLLIGAPAGFIGSRAYARSHALTEGQAGLITFASEFGIWQALGWREQLDIGEERVCFEIDICYYQTSDRVPFTTSIIGAVGGMTVGILASRHGVTSGTASLVSAGGYWGTWFGFALSVLTNAADGSHGALSGALIGSDLGVALAIPVSSKWQPSASRVRLISAGGLAGGLAGLGFALLTSVDNGDTALGMVLAGNVGGMIAAASMSKETTAKHAAIGGSLPALLTIRDKTQWGFPAPTPTVLNLKHSVAGKDKVMGVKVGLFHVEF